MAAGLLVVEPFLGGAGPDRQIVVERIKALSRLDNVERFVEENSIYPAEKSPRRIDRVKVFVGFYKCRLG